MIRAFPTGRLSNLTAVMLVSFVINILVTILCALGLYMLKIESMDFEGSLLFGVVMGVTGFLFAGITALFSQIFNSAKGTSGSAFAFLGIAYVLRGVGDVGNEPLSLISPLGIILRTEVYVRNLWYPIWITLLLALIIIAAAFYFNSQRDLGEGLIPSKPGKRYASPFLSTPFGLMMKLNTKMMLTWTICAFILGATYGSVLVDMDTFLADNEMFQQILNKDEGYTMAEQFITMLMSIFSIVSTIPVLLEEYWICRSG